MKTKLNRTMLSLSFDTTRKLIEKGMNSINWNVIQTHAEGESFKCAIRQQ